MPHGGWRLQLSDQGAGARHGSLPAVPWRLADQPARRARDPHLCGDGRGQAQHAAAALGSPRVAFAGNVRNHGDRKHTSEIQSLMRISYAVFCLKQQLLTNITLEPHTLTKKL